MEIFEFKTSQKQKHRTEEQKATHHVKASNQAEATRMLKTWIGSLKNASMKILSCRELSGSAAKNVSKGKLITSENYNRWHNPAKGNKNKPARKQPAQKASKGVDWKTIDNLSHNREVDGFSDEEKELIDNL